MASTESAQWPESPSLSPYLLASTGQYPASSPPPLPFFPSSPFPDFDLSDATPLSPSFLDSLPTSPADSGLFPPLLFAASTDGSTSASSLRPRQSASPSGSSDEPSGNPRATASTTPSTAPFLPAPASPTTSSPSLQSNSASSPSSAPSKVGGRRKRAGGRALSEEERVARRRLQHRQIDATRRSKEADAIQRLHSLMEQQTEGSELAGRLEFAAEEKQESGASKSDRVSVLERGIASLSSQHERIQHLQLLCARMEAACQSRDRQLTQFVRHLQDVASSQGLDLCALFSGCPVNFTALPVGGRTSPYPLFPHLPGSALFSHLSDLDRRNSLNAQWSLSSTLCMTMKVMPEGIFVDATDRFLQAVCYSREEFLLTSMHANHPRRCPTIIPPEEERPRVGGAPVQQYGHTREEIARVLTGRQSTAYFQWRCRTGDGRVLEVSSFMVAAADDDEERLRSEDVSDESMPRRRVVCVHSIDDAVEVDRVEKINKRLQRG